MQPCWFIPFWVEPLRFSPDLIVSFWDLSPFFVVSINKFHELGASVEATTWLCPDRVEKHDTDYTSETS